MMSVSTHVLDTAVGRPVTGLRVTLEVHTPDGWTIIVVAATDDDGRVAGFGDIGVGEYRLVFDTIDYVGPDAFFPEVGIVFQVTPAIEHYHVPLLLSPFGYSVYRGS